MHQRPATLDHSLAPAAPNLSARTVSRAQAALTGGTSRWLPFVGPAVVASVAYIDPGNVATNTAAGAQYGYALVWVVVTANAIAMLFQALSARLGIVTGRNLPELCRDHFPRPLVWFMWIGSEIAAMATDLAEFLGGAIGLSLLFGVPLLVGMVAIGLVTYALLGFQRAGFRPLELVIGGMVALIGVCYLLELLIAPVHWGALVAHVVIPTLPDRHAVTLAVGIVGATVMPHAIYLHSSLTQNRVVPRNENERRRLLRLSDREVVAALSFAGLINIAMMAMAAAAFHDGRHNGVATIETAYHTLAPLLGPAAAAAFMVSLIASGLSSSVVGTMAGQVIMQGFVRRSIPVLVRRLVTMAPAFAVVLAGVDATHALIWSQVVLSLALPMPMLALLFLMRRRGVMGVYAMRPRTQIASGVATATVLALNLGLVAGM